jgi:two-component system, OmpR family, sensor kinase
VRVPRRPLTLRGRLIATLLVFSAVGLVVFAGASVALLRQKLQDQVDGRLQHQVDLLLRHFPAHRSFDDPQRLVSEYLITIFGPDGTVQVGQQPGQSGGPSLDLAVVQRHPDRPFTVPDQAGGSAWRVRAVELPDQRVGAVALSLALPVDAIVRQLLIIEGIVGGIVLALIGMVATVVVRLGLRPLTRIESTAEAIAGGELGRRVPDSDPRTETGRLGAALNVMLGRLAAALHERERSEDRLRQFVADASHELRTPLTSIRGFAELYRRGGARTPAEVELLTGRIEAEATRMGVLVEDLLLLARLDQERALDITDVDLLVLAADAVHDAKAREPDRPLRLVASSGAVHVLGDEHKLRQVVTNLVTNALTHTPAGTPVRVVVRRDVPAGEKEPPVAQAGISQQHTALGVLEVHDEGPGIPADQASHVFDRFFSASSGGASSGEVSSSGAGSDGVDRRRTRHRGGSGLGLAITAAILEAHNGSIELRTTPRYGTTFRVLLPLA